MAANTSKDLDRPGHAALAGLLALFSFSMCVIRPILFSGFFLAVHFGLQLLNLAAEGFLLFLGGVVPALEILEGSQNQISPICNRRFREAIDNHAPYNLGFTISIKFSQSSHVNDINGFSY